MNDILKKIINPTGLGIRNDRSGHGTWGAPRGNRIHKGIDRLCVPGQTVKSYITGIYIRPARPYADDTQYTGALFGNKWIRVKMFYVHATMLQPGQNIKAGEVFGIAQDISLKYNKTGMDEKKKMLPHVHYQIDSIDPLVLEELLCGLKNLNTMASSIED